MRWSILSLSAIVLFAGAFVLLSEEAEASHLRGGSLFWHNDANSTQGAQQMAHLNVTGTINWRWNSVGSPGVGAPCGGQYTFGLLNATTRTTVGPWGSLQFRLEAIAVDPNANENWAVCKIVTNVGGKDGVNITVDRNAGPYILYYYTANRIGTDHVNNANGWQNLETYIEVRNNIASPKVFVPPMWSCAPNALCHIPILSWDLDNDPLYYRFATSAESSCSGNNPGCGNTFTQPGPAYAPNSIYIDQNKPELLWDTTGATMSGGPTTLYSTVFMTIDEDANGNNKSKVPMDFLIRIEPVDPPYWVVPPSVSDNGIHCGGTVVMKQGQFGTFTMRAAHNTSTKDVRMFLSPITPLTALPGSPGLAIGAPANPIDGVFTWTPPLSANGKTFPLTFYAHTGPHYADPCTVNIRVKPLIPPVPDFDCLTPKRPYNQILFTDKSMDPDGNLTDLIWQWGDGTQNMTAPGATPDHFFPGGGFYNITLTAIDEDNLQASVTKMCWARENLPPIIDPPGHHYVYEGQTLQVAITGHDPNGDATWFSWAPGNLPASANFHAGNAIFTWTPAEGMRGEYGPIPFSIHDFEFADTDDLYVTVIETPEAGSDSMSDVDGDNIPDDRDNCPTTPNGDQADADGDGIGDICESTTVPAQSNEEKETQEEETPVVGGTEEESDADQDGIMDSSDNCPFIKNPGQENLDGDDRGDVCDADIDGDRVNELSADGKILDNCPFTPNPLQADSDGDGVGDVCQGDMDADGIPDAEDDCPSGLCHKLASIEAEPATEPEADAQPAPAQDTPLPVAVVLLALAGAGLRRRCS